MVWAWVNEEADTIITGAGQVRFENYGFLHRVHGQVRPVEATLMAGRNFGFMKRVHLVWPRKLTVREHKQLCQ